jgi:hypothetical protein
LSHSGRNLFLGDGKHLVYIMKEKSRRRKGVEKLEERNGEER